jgi:putative transposase
MWSRKRAICTYPDITLWPKVLDTEVDASRRETFLLKVKAMEMYFAQFPVKEIERVTGLARQVQVQLAKKCVRLSDDGQVFGFRALLPFYRTKKYERSAPVSPKRPQQRGGSSGVLGNMLSRFPDLEPLLVRYIRQEAKRRHIHEFCIRPKDLHTIFIAVLKSKGIAAPEWPFCTQHLGARSIAKFMKHVLDANFSKAVNEREGQVARAHLNVGTGSDVLLYVEAPYEVVEIDSYRIEGFFSVAIQTPEGTETEVPLDRLWLIAAVDRFSSAVLAYSIVYSSEVNSNDVLDVIRRAGTERWEPKTISFPGLHYPSGGGLPSGVIPAAHGALWTSTFFDGALAHLAERIHDTGRKMLGFAINWGPVAHFERRPNVERLFRQIGSDVFRRLPSTTGSSPQKGRAEDAQEKAVRYRIRACEVEELLDVKMAQHNATPSEGISYLTPLDAIRYFVENPAKEFLIRRLPESSRTAAKIMGTREEATVRGGRSTGRRPYVQVDRAKYTNPVLANSGHLLGSRLILEIDESDMRQFRAFLKNGAEIGVLKAQGKWGLTKHSRATRKNINRLISSRILVISEFEDPIQAYLAYLSTSRDARKAKPNVRQAPSPPTPRAITELTKVSAEAGKRPTFVRANKVPIVTPTPPPRMGLMPDMPDDFFTKIKNRR